jgi:hypothetical protein
MLMLAEVAERLRDSCPSFRVVGDAAQFAAVIDQLPDTPAVYVLPLNERAGPNRFASGAVHQEVESQFGVVMAVRNVSDARGSAAGSDLTALREEVAAALIGWMPTGCSDLVIYAGGELVTFVNGCLWWQDEYLTAFPLRKT